MFQSCENESRNLDLEGLHESIVDGSDDEDELAGSIDVSIDIEYTWSEICIIAVQSVFLNLLSYFYQSLALQTDVVRDALEKDPKERTSEDLDILLRFTQELEAFKPFTMGVTKAFCEGMLIKLSLSTCVLLQK